MGLLDNLLGSSFDDPKTSGALALAQGLLSAPRGMQGLTGGLLGYQQATAEARKQQEAEQLRKMQIQQAQQQAAQQQRQQAFLQGIQSPQMQASQQAMQGGGGPTMANAAQMPAVDPAHQQLMEAMKAGVISYPDYLGAIRKDTTPKYLNVAAGGSVFDERAGKAVYTAPKDHQDPSAVKEYKFAKDQGYTGSLQQFMLEQKAAGRPQVSVDMRGDNAYSAAQGKEYSDMMAGINKAAFTAPSQIRKLERMTQLLDGVDGGKLAPAGLEVASALNSFGIKVDPKLGNKEAAQALSRELAGGLRQPGTGPMTDKDFDNFLAQIPDLSKSAQGRQQINATMKSAMNRDMKIAQLARDYERKNGRIDGRFLDDVASFIAENPVVSAPDNWKVKR